MDSYTSVIEAEQELRREDNEQIERNAIVSRTAYVRAPASVHHVLEKVNLVSGEQTEEQHYITSEGHWSKEDGAWSVQPKDQRSHRLRSLEALNGPLVQWHRFEKHAEKVIVTEEEGRIVLRLKLEGEAVRGGHSATDVGLSQLPKVPQVRDGAAADTPDAPALSSHSDDSDVAAPTTHTDIMNLIYIIDPSTYLPVQIDSVTAYAVSDRDDPAIMQVSERYEIAYNETPPIQVPPEVLGATR
ncbi:hypothetical protein PA598K_02788 [Paenibacillus sp. 598K]|nr:hypothetical protein PA598K_02788 [Paenibacillus sp. 598K]